ncbi:MAG: hypothetical protein Dbin4_02697 [Alphaproteobacteria bacterium]|nr:hypothetical protein [Alphaproteobacteria bacterium]
MPAIKNQVEIWPVAKLRGYDRNARTHSPAQIEQIAASIVEFGWTNPVLATADGEIIAGHGRVAAAKRLGLTDAPVIVLDHLSDAQRRAYVIADNKLALNAGWDDEILAAELAALKLDDFDLSITGFSENEIDRLLVGLDDGGGVDTVIDPLKSPVTKIGDIWELGAHRLICGDSTNADDVGRLLGDVRPHLMVTDPPYGVEYDADWRNHAIRSSGAPIGGRAVGKVTNDHNADWRDAWALFPGDAAYVWHGGTRAHLVAESLMASGFEIRSQIIWAKNNIVIGRGDYHHKHEPCWYAVRKGRAGHWTGDRKQSTVWDIDKPMKSETGHSTQKPVECMRRPIINNSVKGDAVYEPFSGSGTTLIAAEMTERRCFAVEIDPGYCDVAVDRWEKLTGGAAVKK